MITFKNIYEIAQAFPTEQDCINHLTKLRWSGNVVSPFDETSKIYVCKDNKYKCKNTGKYFNVKTDTIFDDTKVPLQKWFMAMHLCYATSNPLSSHQLAQQIGTTQKTAWYMIKRLKFAQKANHKDFIQTFMPEPNHSR